MTSRETTGLLPLRDETSPKDSERRWSDTLWRLGFGAISWPWLLYSLWGGTQASKRRLLARIELEADALPHLGSWKADTGFLHRIVDAIEERRPRIAVELGAGASTLVCAKALSLHGGGRLISYDQHADFVAATGRWLHKEGVEADLRHAPLEMNSSDWPGKWYSLHGLPDSIDMLIIDGPPWAVHPLVRGGADTLFDRLSPGAVILLDDAARPGERIVARRWKTRWPDIMFERVSGSTKGTLIGRKRASGANIVHLPTRRNPVSPAVWRARQAASIVGLFACGWLAHIMLGDISGPAHAGSFIDEASSSYMVSITRQQMRTQLESAQLDRKEITAATGLPVPQVPPGWKLADVQVFPSEAGMALVLFMRTPQNEGVSLFVKRAETPAEKSPLLEVRQPRAVAYWEEGPFAYALTGELPPARMLALAAQVAKDTDIPTGPSG
tara:strand:+ start:167 stop:1492 length:1326 start_codon:yes stop_codon:yes gene_type:complete